MHGLMRQEMETGVIPTAPSPDPTRIHPLLFGIGRKSFFSYYFLLQLARLISDYSVVHAKTSGNFFFRGFRIDILSLFY